MELISLFVCDKDKDIEMFLKEKAIMFEKLGKSRTFLLFDGEEGFHILAYFTLAIQVLKVPQGLLSGRKTKQLDGFASKYKGETITEFPAMLIGQIGKNDLYTELISGFEIMEYCLATLMAGQVYLGGRIILLECKNIPALITLYEKFGFKIIQRDYNDGELFQMIRVLGENEIIENS